MKKYLPLFIIVIIFMLAWYFDIPHYLNFEQLKANQKDLTHFIEENFLYAALIFAVLYVIIVAASLPVAAFMSIAAGVLFHQMAGTLIVVLAATIGATLFFISAKLASKDILEKRAGSAVTKIKEGFEENAFSYLLTLRLIPLFPFVVVNMASALLLIPLRTFFLATFFGIIPGTFVFVSIGTALADSLEQPNFSAKIILEPKILIALTGLGLLSLLPVLYKRLRNKDKK